MKTVLYEGSASGATKLNARVLGHLFQTVSFNRNYKINNQNRRTPRTPPFKPRNNRTCCCTQSPTSPYFAVDHYLKTQKSLKPPPFEPFSTPKPKYNDSFFERPSKLHESRANQTYPKLLFLLPPPSDLALFQTEHSLA